MEKNVRLRIASNYPNVLKFEGLSPREFTARKKWNELSPEDQESRRNNARNALLHARSMIVEGNTSTGIGCNSNAKQNGILNDVVTLYRSYREITNPATKVYITKNVKLHIARLSLDIILKKNDMRINVN